MGYNLMIFYTHRVCDDSVFITFPNEQMAADLAELNVILVKGLPRMVSHADSRKVYMKVFDLPYEVDNGSLKAKISEFGHVFN